MKNLKNSKWLIRIGLLFIILIAVLAKPIYSLLQNREHLSKREFADYRNLFKKYVQEDLFLINTIESRYREPESQYTYNKKYNIFITKVHISPDFNLRKAIIVGNEPANINKSELYFSIIGFNCKILLKSEKIPLVAEITLNVSGGNFNSISLNNNQSSYYYQFKAFSLSFNRAPSYITAEASNSSIPANVTFIRDNGFLYIVLMTVAKGKEEMQSDQLYTIINNATILNS